MRHIMHCLACSCSFCHPGCNIRAHRKAVDAEAGSDEIPYSEDTRLGAQEDEVCHCESDGVRGSEVDGRSTGRSSGKSQSPKI
jgi:hypothetical protein